jgi:Transposase DDE domain group 1
MNSFASLVSIHLSGEAQNPLPDDLTLDTLPGKFTLTRTDAALTAYGGLVAWSSFLKHTGLVERFAGCCPVMHTSPNAAPVREVVHSFMLSALVEGKRFSHVRWLSDDPALATIMNMSRVRGEDALPRLAKEMSVEAMRDWMQQPQTELYAALPDRFIADWDSTVNTRYGHQADAALGYNPHKRGRKSHHPLICVAARTRLCLHLEWRPGDTVSATDWQPAMEKLWSHPTIRERLWLNRGDAGFGQEGVMAWHEQAGEKRPKYLFKLRLTANVRRAIAKVPWPLWEGAPTLGCQQIAETTVKLHGWSRERRVVIVRTLKPVNPTPQDEFWDNPEDEVAVYVTNLEKNEATPEQIALLYAGRADTENVFDELKNQWGFRGYCSQRAVVTELAARLVLLTYNLWSLFTRLLGLTPGHHSEAVTSRRDFLFLAAQVVESGRQRVVKLAVKSEWWAVLKACYERLRTWLATTAPQLEAAGQLLRRLARQTTENPDETLRQPATT